MPKTSQSKRDSVKAYAVRRKAKGLCLHCPNPAKVGKSRCEDCTKVASVHQNNLYARRIARGVCANCGKVKVEKFQRCIKCRKILNERIKNRKLQKS